VKVSPEFISSATEAVMAEVILSRPARWSRGFRWPRERCRLSAAQWPL